MPKLKTVVTVPVTREYSEFRGWLHFGEAPSKPISPYRARCLLSAIRHNTYEELMAPKVKFVYVTE